MFAVRKTWKNVALASMAITSSMRGHSAMCSDNAWHNAGLGLPKFASVTPESLENAVNGELGTFKGNMTQLNKSFATVPTTKAVDELERISMPLHKDWGIVNHLLGVHNSDKLRDVHKSLQVEVVKSFQELGQSKEVYNALDRIRNDPKRWKQLDEAQQRIISDKLLSMKHAGVALPKDKQDHFNALQLEAKTLSSQFKNNVLDATKAFKHTITDPADMQGVPEGSKALLSQRAVAAGHAESTPADGPWVVTLDLPSYQACMQHVRNSSIREAVYKGYIVRASDQQEGAAGTLNNTPIIEKTLQLKHEMATMLGYKNYAEMSLATKMAGTVDVAQDMIENLRNASISAAKKDLQEVEDFAKEHCGLAADASLALWDVGFYSERLREAKYGFKEEELKVYFALPNVLKGLFSLAEKLFGVSIESVPTTTASLSDSSKEVSTDAKVEVWHPDVQFFKVRDSQTKAVVAAFYLDPYARPEDKNGGAWMDVCLQRSKLLHQTPVAYLVCNGSPPTGDKPALMTFREVETLFHEFGHGLQHMLTNVEYGEASGIANIEWDAVELPSQFMENWCYDNETLAQFAKHYKTGESIPAEYVDKLKASKNFQSGMQMLRQLYFGALDLKLHTTTPPSAAAGTCKSKDDADESWVYAVQKDIASRFTILPPLPNDRFLNGFSHIFGGGYAAGYYSYKWAEVMSADAFGAFEEVGLNNTEQVKRLGRKFRATVLGSGGGKHPSDVYRNFRGRDPTVDALLRHSGL